MTPTEQIPSFDSGSLIFDFEADLVDYQLLHQATNGFDESMKIGDGGSATVSTKVCAVSP
jgi:hypothetical protein